MSTKKEQDLAWVIALHKQAKEMGLSDEKIKEIAKTTSGAIDPQAMEEYLAMEFE